MTNINKFNGKSIVYSKFRPDYPDQLVIDLIDENNLNDKSVVADIGSGTGIMTRKLLNFGLKVFAVEPNMEMRTVAEEKLKSYKFYFSVDGSAENTSLSPSSVDFITVAQAFHWFDLRNFQRECHRILKPHGKVAIISNERIRETAINQEIESIFKRFCPEFKGFSNGLVDSKDIFDRFFKDDYSLKMYDNPLMYNKKSFIGRHLSSSFSLNEDHEYYPMLVEALTNTFEKYQKNGTIILPNVTKCRFGFVNNI
ncbi:class I SAM-dependent methyltransferase [Lederbergia citri]|uniref:Methyltransferase domain-containing protein n=1 Tax=Lederbergia citri TaxID=2833580 RepID=A0A942TAK8_9BACI|nr:class I SAM-dependent methyltransferase [Lederbergia citri]MBS4194200.1 methyltransferase domain-containing protein [Lederbergia citri]